MYKKAFTLAETIIVLVIIGIMAAILLPIAKRMMPNEDILKFQKAHKDVTGAITEVVNSNKYFLNGDLTMSRDGRPSHPCLLVNAVAETLRVKTFRCTKDSPISREYQNCPTSNIPCAYTDSTFQSMKESLASLNGEFSPGNIVFDMFMSSGQAGGYIQFPNKVEVIFFSPQGGECKDSTGNIIRADEAKYCKDNFNKSVSSGNFVILLDYNLNGIPIDTTVAQKFITMKNKGVFAYTLLSNGKIINSTKVDKWLKYSPNEKNVEE